MERPDFDSKYSVEELKQAATDALCGCGCCVHSSQPSLLLVAAATARMKEQMDALTEEVNQVYARLALRDRRH